MRDWKVKFQGVKGVLKLWHHNKIPPWDMALIKRANKKVTSLKNVFWATMYSFTISSKKFIGGPHPLRKCGQTCI